MQNINSTEKVIRYIKKNILDGTFQVGSKLPSERAIAEHFQISRIPVRQAIQKLCEENILKQVPYSSPIIQGFKHIDLFHEGEPFSNSDIQEMYVESLRARQLIESEATRLAAKNALDFEIKYLKKLCDDSISELEKVSKGLLEECSDIDLSFHMEIIKASHSPLLVKYYSLIPKTIYSNQFFGFKYRTSMQDMIVHHKNIIMAIEKRDSELAYSAMYNHLEDVILLFQKDTGE